MYNEFGLQAFKQVRNNNTVNLDWPCKRKNGQIIWFRIAGEPVLGADRYYVQL